MWYSSLRNLLKNIRNGCKWHWIRDIRIPLQLEKNKNPIYPAKDGKLWTKYIENLKRTQYQIHELLSSSKELSNFSCVTSMRKRLKKLMKWLDTLTEDAETSDYLLMTQYDKLRALRVEIRVLGYKVAGLLREKNSKRSYLSNIFQFVYNSSTTESCSSNGTDLLSPGTPDFPRPTNNTPHFKSTKSYPEQSQAFSTTSSGDRRRSRRISLIPPKWYTRIPRERRSLVQKIMVNDIINGTLSEETVTRVSSTFRISREEVNAIARYLDEIYKVNKINVSI